MSELISVPIGMAISQYSNLNHACEDIPSPFHYMYVQVVALIKENKQFRTVILLKQHLSEQQKTLRFTVRWLDHSGSCPQNANVVWNIYFDVHFEIQCYCYQNG